MKKTLLIFSILISGIVIGGVVTNLVSAGGRVQVEPRYPDGTATTTWTYLKTTDTASSTFISSLGNSEGADLNICATASTSAAILNFQLYFTIDTNDNPTWFGDDGAVVASGVSITHSVGAPVNSWSLATTSMGTNYTCKTIDISNNRSKFVLVKMGVVGADTAVWRNVNPLIGY